MQTVGLWLAVALPIGVLTAYVLPRGLRVLGEAAILAWGAVLLVRGYERQRRGR